MTKNPLVSIIIPVYNGSNYLSQAIDSALEQTYKNIEIIVVNDGSKDGGATEKIALSYGDRIKYYAKENGGVSSALNYGIQKMKGEYFSWLSHDDKYTPSKIQSQISLRGNLNAEKLNTTIFMCDTNFIDKDSTPIKRVVHKIREGLYSNTQMFSTIFSGYSISGCALLIPKCVFDKTGTFNVQYRYMQDMDMWYRALADGVDFYYKSDVGVLSRVHDSQTTVTAPHLGKKDAQFVGEFLLETLEDLYDKKQNLLKKYMYLCFKRNNIVVGERAYKKLVSQKKISLLDRIKLFFIRTYGKIRPSLVKIYYKIFLRVSMSTKKDEK